jgi:hypothetical protein
MSESTELDLTTFVLSVSTAAFMGLEEKNANLELAKHNIDLLDLLWRKTQGNRTPDEDRLLSQLLLETRLKFVEAQKKARS